MPRFYPNVVTLAHDEAGISEQRSTIDILATSNMPGRWASEGKGLPIDDPNFALFTGRRGFRVVAGGMLYRSEGVVGLSNVVAEAADAVAVWRSLILLSAQTFPRLPLVGYESGGELAAALDAGFEIGDPLRIWVQGRSP